MSELNIVCKQAKNIGAEKKVNGEGQILPRRADPRDAVARDIGEAPRLHAEESVWRVLRRIKSQSQKRHVN
jgi:hypothetical protein